MQKTIKTGLPRIQPAAQKENGNLFHCCFVNDFTLLFSFVRHAFIGKTYIDTTLHRHQTPTKVVTGLVPSTPEEKNNHLGWFVAQMPTPVKLFEEIASKRQKK
jgi:hypothetical protein